MLARRADRRRGQGGVRMQKVVLITGCSTGIGRALALEFNRKGHRVYATARRRETLAALESQGIRGLALDVTDDAAIDAVAAVVREEAGHLDVLINNAGLPQVGAVVDLTRDDLRRHYETNVISPVMVTSKLLPLLRAAVTKNGSATLANVGSIVGLVATPFAGAYCSGKSALHALTDASRMELAPFGIDVVSIQPGGVRSSFGEHSAESIRLPDDSLFRKAEQGLLARAQAGQAGAVPAEEFAVPVVEKLLLTPPPRIIRGGTNSVRLPLLKRLLPASVLDAKLSKLFGLDSLR
jgi:NAD(P)-dependent dehydrogenase (short-subunit alcohol dehydrogenase family)